MSKGNPVIKSTIVSNTRKVGDPSLDQRISDIESQLRPFKRMELPGADNGERIIKASNIVIPDA